MNSLILDITPNVTSITRRFTNANWEGILRDISLRVLKQYEEVRATNRIPYLDTVYLQELQWRYGFERNNQAVLSQFTELYSNLYSAIAGYVNSINPTKLLTVVQVMTANNVFQLHLGYA